MASSPTTVFLLLLFPPPFIPFFPLTKKEEEEEEKHNSIAPAVFQEACRSNLQGPYAHSLIFKKQNKEGTRYYYKEEIRTEFCVG
jgi:hypothetical protein